MSHGGAGESLKKIGYEGEFRVMENGTDFDRRGASGLEISELKKKHGIKDELVFLFIGRMMWYKNQKFTLDALKILKERE